MNNYDFDYRYSVRDTLVKTVVNIAIVAGVALAGWVMLIGIDRLMGLFGIL